MLTFEQIKELIELVASHRMTGLELERSGFRLQIDGYQATETVQMVAAPHAAAAPSIAAAPAVVAAAPQPAPVAPAAPAPEPAAAEDELPADALVVNSPIVGTFYRAPNPEAPPFVEIGATVKPGQVVCIVEAMKLMNEIESDVSGEVLAVYPENGQPVEYGEPLFAIKKRPV